MYQLVSKVIFPSLSVFKRYAELEPNKSSLLPSMWWRQHSLLVETVFSCFLPNLINRWIISIKELYANRQSSLTPFKQLQCASCPQAKFCQSKKPPHTWIRVLSQSGSCLFKFNTTDPTKSIKTVLKCLLLQTRHKNQN